MKITIIVSLSLIFQHIWIFAPKRVKTGMFILMLIFGAKIQNGRGLWNSLRSLYYSTESVSEKVSFSCCKQSLNIVQKCHWRTLLLAVSPDFISKKMLSCTRKKGWLRNYRRANRDFFIALLSKNVMSWAKNMASNHECPTKDRLTQCLKITPKKYHITTLWVKRAVFISN